MSCNIEQDVRLITKYSTISGVTPTIPLSGSHNDGTWLPTDLYIGELFLNSADSLVWIRTDDGILPISGTISGTGSFIGDYVPVSGGTFSGCVYIPCLTVGTATIDELIVGTATGNMFGTFSGDGSGLTGIVTTWDGGTVSNPVFFTNTVDFTNTINLNGPVVGNLDLTGDVEISGGVSASIFYGDGSGLTNLPTGTYSDIYTTGASLSGNEIVFDRNDLLQYSVDLTPILATQGVANITWNSGSNQLDLTLLNGDVVSTTIDGFDTLTALTSVTAPEFYGGTYYGSFVGTFSGTIENDIFSTTASLVGTELIIQRNDGGTFSTDLSSLSDAPTLEEVLINGNYAGTNWIEFPKPYGIKSNSTSYNDNITFNGGSIRLTSETATASSTSFLDIGKDGVNLTTDGTITINAHTTFTVDGDLSPSFVGIQYKSDYSANFVTHSLITKQYVDSVISGATTSNVFQPGTGTNAIVNKGDGTSLASGSYAYAMGQNNTANSSFANALGFGNTASGNYSTLIGRNNISTSDYTYIMGDGNAGGANSLTLGATNINTGSYNLVSGLNHNNSSNYSGVFGRQHTVADAYGFAAGYLNTVGKSYAFGYNNILAATNIYNFAAGSNNTITSNYSATLGNNNTVSTQNYGMAFGNGNGVSGLASIVGGQGNDVSGNYSYGFGRDNTVTNIYGGALGFGNSVAWTAHAIGHSNTINSITNSNHSMIAGGFNNDIIGPYNFIGAGTVNNIDASYSSIIGGLSNTVSGDYSSILGGSGNTASGENSSILGGENNNVSGLNAIILGGQINNVTNQEGSIIGGNNNSVTANRSSILGGRENSVTQPDGAIIGGIFNTVSGANSTIIGGTGSVVSGINSAIIGGSGLTLADNDTVLVPKLKINSLPTGTSINNLGIDASGNVIIGSGGSASTPPLNEVLLVGNSTLGSNIIMGTDKIINATGSATMSIFFTEGTINLWNDSATDRDGRLLLNTGTSLSYLYNRTYTGATYSEGKLAFNNSTTKLNVYDSATTAEAFLAQDLSGGTPTQTLVSVDTTGRVSQIYLEGNGYMNMYADDNTNSINIDMVPSSGLTVTTTNGTGIEYANDYSATFTNRSLVDKAYVDNLPVEIVLAASDEITALTTGTNKVTFRMPHAMTLTSVRCSLSTAQTSGSTFTVDINESGTSILSTKLTIDNTEKTSTTATTPAVISDANLADDAEITIDIDTIGDGTAKGLKITLIGKR